MSIYDKAIKQLEGLTDRFGFNPAEVDQGSLEWFVLKFGVASASNADKIVAKRDSATRQTYMASLISQVCNMQEPEEMPFKQLEWGKKYEAAARDALSVALGLVEIKEIPFIYLDSDLRAGASPDGLVESTCIELKVPFNSENFIKFAAFDTNKTAWRWQSQAQIFMTKAERHIFAQYDPRSVLCHNLHYIETEISDADQKTIADAIPQFVEDMDKALSRLGVVFGEHWIYLKNLRNSQEVL